MYSKFNFDKVDYICERWCRGKKGNYKIEILITLGSTNIAELNLKLLKNIKILFFRLKINLLYHSETKLGANDNKEKQHFERQ